MFGLAFATELPGSAWSRAWQSVRCAQYRRVAWECSARSDRRAARAPRPGSPQPLLPDDLLGTLNPLWSTSEPHARVVGLRRETADTTTLLLHTGRTRTRGTGPASSSAIGTRLDGVWHWRTYSVTSRPGDPPLAVTVTAVPGRHGLRRAGAPHAGRHVAADRAARRRVRAAGAGAREAAVRHRGQRHHPGDGHAARPRRHPAGRPRAARSLVHCDRTPDDVVFGLGAARRSPRRPGCALVERHTALDGPAHPGRARRRRARLGGPPDLGLRAGRPARRPGRPLGPRSATRTRCASSGSSRPRPAADAGTGGRVTFTTSKIESRGRPRRRR